jgi:hypothetical protein
MEEIIMYIRNKQESYEMIKKLNLNLTNEVVFQKGQYEQVKVYLDNNPWKYYVLRDKKNSGSKLHRYKLTYDEVLQYIGEYNIFSVAESSLNFEEHRILCGEMQIDRDWNLAACLHDICIGSVRDCVAVPKYLLSFNVLDGYEPRINGLKQAIDYIFIHELFHVVVEFSLFDIPVGRNKENIIIWELRNY